jgi:outer membrane protein OmpA-like peptidoglycan-associated protein
MPPRPFRLSLSTMFLFALAQAALSGCEDKKSAPAPSVTLGLSAASATWTKIAGDFGGKLGALKKDQGQLAASLKAHTVSDEDGLGKYVHTQIETKLGAQTSQVGALEERLAKHRAAVDEAMKKSDRVALTGAVNDAIVDLGAQEKQFATWKTELSDLNRGFNAVRTSAEEAAKHSGSELNFADLDFKAGSAEMDFSKKSSKDAFARLLGFAKSCKELTFELHGHTSREGDAQVNEKLSLDRAQAVRKALVEKGVEASKITATKGLGSSKSLAPEPNPGSPEEKAMKPEELTQIRTLNRRIEVDVVSACP